METIKQRKEEELKEMTEDKFLEVGV